MSSQLALKGKLDLDGSGWEKTLRKADEGVENLAHNTAHHLKNALAGAFAVGALEITIDKTIEYGEAIYNSSRRVGESSDLLQQLDYALRLNGSSLEAAIGVIEKFNVTKEKALGNSKDAEKFLGYFKQFGIAAEELKKMRGGEFVLKASDIFKSDVDPQSLIAAFRGIGGKAAGELIPALREGLRQSAEEAKNFTGVMDTGVIATLKDAGDQSKKLWQWTKAIGAGFVTAFEGAKVGVKSLTAGIYGFLSTPLDSLGDAAANGSKAMHEQFDKDAAHFKELRDHLTEEVKPIDLDADDGPSKAEQKAEDKLGRLRDSLHDAQARERTEGLSHEQKILELVRQRLELTRQIEEAGADTEKGLEGQIKLARINGEIKNLKLSVDKAGTNPRIDVDSFKGLGGVLGHTTREIPAIQERLIEAHNRTTTALHRVATALETHNASEGAGGFALP